MDDLKTELKAILDEIQQDIEAINQTMVDRDTLQRLEFMKSQIEFDLMQIESISSRLPFVDMMAGRIKQSMEDFKNG
jgi:hypothetical protein